MKGSARRDRSRIKSSSASRPDCFFLECAKHETDAREDEPGAAVAEGLESTLHEAEHREHRPEDTVREQVVAEQGVLVRRRELRLLVEWTFGAARKEQLGPRAADENVRSGLTRGTG